MAFKDDIKEALAQHGYDVMRSGQLPNILADTSDEFKNNPSIKNICKVFFQDGLGVKILELQTQDEAGRIIALKQIGVTFATNKGYALNLVEYVVTSISYAMGWSKQVVELDTEEQEKPQLSITKLCPQCGAKYTNEKIKFCTKCRVELKDSYQNVKCPTCGETLDVPDFCPYCGWTKQNSNSQDQQTKSNTLPYPEDKDADTLWKEGQDLYNKGQYFKAFPLLEIAANKGHVGAMSFLGECYFSGKGVEINIVEAFKWLEMAGNNGDIVACLLLGDCYASGNWVKQDYNKARKWYTIAAERNNAKAQFYLGSIYIQGSGCCKNYAEGYKWLNRAATQGYAEAETALGHCFINGLGVAVNYRIAIDWYKKAADKGIAEAHLSLSNLYNEGKGPGWTPNFNEQLLLLFKSSEHLQQAADLGLPAAQYTLGRAYLEHTHGVFALFEQMRQREAFKWLHMAAEQGYTPAQTHIGELYMQTNNYKPAEAVKWFEKAAIAGDVEAQAKLGQCYLYNQGVTGKSAEAAKWLKLAGDKNHQTALRNLGYCYYHGIGVPKDKRMAKQLGFQGFSFFENLFY